MNYGCLQVTTPTESETEIRGDYCTKSRVKNIPQFYWKALIYVIPETKEIKDLGTTNYSCLSILLKLIYKKETQYIYVEYFKFCIVLLLGFFMVYYWS